MPRRPEGSQPTEPQRTLTIEEQARILHLGERIAALNALIRREKDPEKKKMYEERRAKLKTDYAAATTDTQPEPVPTSAEPKERSTGLGLNEIVAESMNRYTEAGLDVWKKDVGKTDFSKPTPEKLQQIETYKKEGYEVIGIMPGREAMLKGLVDAMKKLKPTFVKDGKQHAANDPYIWEYLSDNLFKPPFANPELKAWIDSLPVRPYLLLAQPTAEPPKDSRNKTVTEQLQWFEEQKKRDEWRTAGSTSSIHVMHPGEYALTQTVVTVRDADETHGRVELTPFDSQTYTRFIDLPVSGGGVPYASWSPDRGRLRFGRDVAERRDPRSGVRLAVRVEL